MRSRHSIEEIRRRTYKSRDAWWTVVLVDPLASRLVQLTAGYRWITPNRLTFTAFVLGLGSAACFARADHGWLIAGALLFHLSFVVDCMDGKIARLNGTGSVFGVWLDFTLDQLRVVICAVALMAGQYAATDDLRYLAMAGVVLVLDMFRYLNAWQVGKVKNEMRAMMAERRGAPATFVEELVHEIPAGEAELADVGDAAMDVNSEFRSRFAPFIRLRNYLVRHRIRIHLVSGIEFQMAVFVVGPITGAVIWVPAVAGALLLAFELLLVYKLWLATKAFDREMASLPTPPEATGARVGHGPHDPAALPVTP
jgi:phosphatidylglycerophosphate synthase